MSGAAASRARKGGTTGNGARGFTAESLQEAVIHLRAADPRLAPLIDSFGAPERLVAKGSSCFTSLAKSVLYQQLAGKAAAAIYARFLAVCGVPDDSQLTPAAVLAATPEALRGCGLSGRKAEYVQDLAAHFADGRLSDGLLTSLPDDELRARLTAVRGIGPWTADMFQIFHLGSPDVLPTGDLGVRKGLAHLCGLGAGRLPSPAEMEQLTEGWRPYRSVGSYYMWRIELPPATAKRTAAAGAKAGRAGARAKLPRAQQPPGTAGAAAAAAVDVGVTAGSPMLAAAAGVRRGAAAGAVRSTAAAAAAIAATPAAEGGSGEDGSGDDDSGDGGAAAAAAAAGSAGAVGPSRDSGSGQGVMTRRQLRWSEGRSPGGRRPGGAAKQPKPRVVDL